MKKKTHPATTSKRAVKALVDSGRIGDVVSVDHVEPVGFWHQAHSYVRGNWRNEKESSFMLLAKSCHDIDWLSYIVGRRCLRVSSFGSLYYFKPENRPEAGVDDPVGRVEVLRNALSILRNQL